jgi:hypothetical protein
VTVPPRVELVGRRDCHLCADARLVVAAVCDEYGLAWAERDVDADPADRERWSDWVPVLLVDGREVDSLRVSERRLRAALATAP